MLHRHLFTDSAEHFGRGITLFAVLLLGLLGILASGGGNGGDGGSNSPGSLQFSASSYSGNEDAGSVTVTVTRSGGSDGAASVTLSDTGSGSATAGTDYNVISPVTLQWADGDASDKNFELIVSPDTQVEGDETVLLALDGASGATLGSPSMATVTIVDDDSAGSVRFGASSFDVAEGDGTVSNVIRVQRVGGASGAISVDVVDAGSGTAGAGGVDYSFSSPTTLSWADGDSSDQYVSITVVDDTDAEGTETVVLSLANPGGGALLDTPSSATVNIADNDTVTSAGELRFEVASYSVAETIGSFSLAVSRVNGSSGAVSVDYATSNGQAQAGSDFQTATGTLSWADGESGTKTFSVFVIDDSSDEGAENFDVVLGNAVGGASLITPSQASVVILDDDNPDLVMHIGDGSGWVAFQDGPGAPWVEWKPTSGNTYQFSVTDAAGRYGVAFHHQEAADGYVSQKIYVTQATLSELSGMEAFVNPLHTVSGTLVSYSGVTYDSAVLAMGIWEDGGEPLTVPYGYTLKVPAGTRDLLAVEFVSSSGQPGNYVLRRDLPVTGDLTGQNVDLGLEGAPVSFTAHTLTGAGTSGEVLSVYYSTANGTSVGLGDTDPGDGSLGYAFLTNADFVQSGAAYSFQVYEDYGTSYKLRVRNRSALVDPGDVTLSLASVAGLSGTAASSTGVAGLDYTPDGASFDGSPVFRGYQIEVNQFLGVSGHQWVMRVSQGWLGASTSYSYPDLDGVSGFESGWGLVSGQTTGVNVAAIVSDTTTTLETIYRQSMAPTPPSPNSQYVNKKLAQVSDLKLDAALEFHVLTW